MEGAPIVPYYFQKPYFNQGGTEYVRIITTPPPLRFSDLPTVALCYCIYLIRVWVTCTGTAESFKIGLGKNLANLKVQVYYQKFLSMEKFKMKVKLKSILVRFWQL